jgi:hypothetical protein
MHKKFFKKREKKIWDLKSLRWDQKSTTFFFFFVYNVNHYATVTPTQSKQTVFKQDNLNN